MGFGKSIKNGYFKPIKKHIYSNSPLKAFHQRREKTNVNTDHPPEVAVLAVVLYSVERSFLPLQFMQIHTFIYHLLIWPTRSVNVEIEIFTKKCTILFSRKF